MSPAPVVPERLSTLPQRQKYTSGVASSSLPQRQSTLRMLLNAKVHFGCRQLQSFPNVYSVTTNLCVGDCVYIVSFRKEVFYLTTHSTRCQTWYRTIQKARKETCCRRMGYSFRLATRVLLYASSHRQDNTYNGLC